MDKAIPSSLPTTSPEGDARVSLAQGKLGQAMLSAGVFGLFGAAAGRALARLGEGKNAPLVGRKFSTVVMALFAGVVAFYSSLRTTAAEAACQARNEAKPEDAALHAEPKQNAMLALPHPQIEPHGSQHDGAVTPAAAALQR